MDHFPAGSRPQTTGPDRWFTGTVTVTPVIEAPAPARVRSALVTFAPAARTHWHTHPLGQTIHILSGQGRAQREGGPVITLNQKKRWVSACFLMQQLQQNMRAKPIILPALLYLILMSITAMARKPPFMVMAIYIMHPPTRCRFIPELGQLMRRAAVISLTIRLPLVQGALSF